MASTATKLSHADRILVIFAEQGPMTHRELRKFTYRFTDDHRIRANELYYRGLIDYNGTKTNPQTGRDATVWKITSEGKKRVKELQAA